MHSQLEVEGLARVAGTEIVSSRRERVLIETTGAQVETEGNLSSAKVEFTEE